MSKEKRNDEFELLKSQIDDLKSIVDEEKPSEAANGEPREEQSERERDRDRDRDLLDSLSNDVEHYHKKVQLKKEKSSVRREKLIAQELQKEKLQLAEEEEEEAERGDEDVDVSAITAAAAAAAAAVGEERPAQENDNESDNILDSELEDEEYSGVPIEVNLNKKKRAEGEESPAPVVKRRRPTKGKKAYPWTKAEDEAIVYYKEDQKYSWKKIEEQLDFRHTWQAIQMRYLRNHKSRNEEWSRFMEVKLINAIRRDWESRWKRIGLDLGKDFSSERCIQKNMELCKRMEMEYVKTIFENKEIKTGYSNPFNDIKDPEAHKKLMLVYMGLDSITYEDSDEEEEGEQDPVVDATASETTQTAAENGETSGARSQEKPEDSAEHPEATE